MQAKIKATGEVFNIDDKGFNNEARYWMSIPNLPDVNKN